MNKNDTCAAELIRRKLVVAGNCVFEKLKDVKDTEEDEKWLNAFLGWLCSQHQNGGVLSIDDDHCKKMLDELDWLW